MKLRNKKTGEIREIKNILVDGMFSVNSLAELNEEWEDYEQTFWYIDEDDGFYDHLLNKSDELNYKIKQMREHMKYLFDFMMDGGDQ